MIEIAPGLRRWTAYHEHWEEQVGSLAAVVGPAQPARRIDRVHQQQPVVSLVSQGEPVLRAGKAALARILR